MQIGDSARLSYHYVTEADSEFLWQLDQDERVMRFINGGRKSTREEIEQVFVPRSQAYSNQPLGWGLWRIRVVATQQDIGWILVRPFGFFTQHPEIDNIELGWRFCHDSWGNGYATEAAKQVKEALYRSGIDTFSAIANPDNTASINIMKKLGMTFSHEFDYKDSVYQETVVVYAT